MLSTPTSRPPFRAEPVEPDLVPAHNRAVMPVTMPHSRRRYSPHRDERGQRDGAAGHGLHSSPVRVNSYDPDAPLPKIGSRWVWEIDQPHARELLEVVEVKWNGEEWWVGTESLLRNDTYPPTGREIEWNDLSRFWEACLPVLPKIAGRLEQFTSRGPAHAPST